METGGHVAMVPCSWKECHQRVQSWITRH